MKRNALWHALWTHLEVGLVAATLIVTFAVARANHASWTIVVAGVLVVAATVAPALVVLLVASAFLRRREKRREVAKLSVLSSTSHS